jgi:hypothetical protein
MAEKMPDQQFEKRADAADARMGRVESVLTDIRKAHRISYARRVNQVQPPFDPLQPRVQPVYSEHYLGVRKGPGVRNL